MKSFTQLPAGYRPATSADRQRFTTRELRGGIALQEGEILEIEDFIVNDSGFVNSDGEVFKSFRFKCASDLKPRLLRLEVFNPYPKDRQSFLSQTKFGKDVFEYTGTQDDLIEFLLHKRLKVVKMEKLQYKPFGLEIYEEKPFALFDYA